MRNISWLRQVATQIILIVIGLYVLLPIYSTARLAFDGSLIGAPTEFHWLPKKFTIEPIFSVLDRPYQSVSFPSLLKNSIAVSGGAAVIAIVMGASLAYAFARFRFPGRRAGLFVLLLTALLPPIAFATPLYILLSALQIRTSLIGLTIVYASFAMPFCVWNMRAAFQVVPKEIEEAAFMDGANDLTTFVNITLPLAVPSIAVAALIAFLMGYSEFALGWLFVDRADTVTLAMSVYAIIQTGGAQPWNILGSLALIMTVPVMVIFVILQNTLLERLMFGSID